MAIRLSAIEFKTGDELREERAKQHGSLTAKLERCIRDICKHHRKRYEAMLFEQEVARLRWFIDERKPNDTAHSYYTRLWVREGMDYRGKREAEDQVRAQERFVLDLTDHPQPVPFAFSEDKDGHRRFDEYRAWAENENRPNFAVKERSDARNKMRASVKKFVDTIINDFCRKSRLKLLDILIANPDYDVKLEFGQFTGGSFEGDVTLMFESGVTFRTHVILKTNYSVCGRPYAQYPLTFHDFVAEPGAKLVAMMSEAEVQDAMGIEPWTPPKKPKRPWTTVKVGDIVELQEGGIALVVGTRKDVVKLYHPERGEWQGTADGLKTIHARTTVRDDWNKAQKDGEDRYKFYMLVETFGGRKEQFFHPNPDNKVLNGMEYGINRDKEARTRAFPLVLEKWDWLMSTPEKKSVATV